VEIAVGIYAQRLFIAEDEADVGLFTGLENLAVAALVGVQLYPLDPVDFFHGMVDAADIYIDDAFADADIGLVLLAAGLNGVGNQFHHGLTAADGIHTGIIDHLNNVTAVGANVKLAVLHIYKSSVISFIFLIKLFVFFFVSL
jgi:hypothetical protein